MPVQYSQDGAKRDLAAREPAAHPQSGSSGAGAIARQATQGAGFAEASAALSPTSGMLAPVQKKGTPVQKSGGEAMAYGYNAPLVAELMTGLKEETTSSLAGQLGAGGAGKVSRGVGGLGRKLHVNHLFKRKPSRQAKFRTRMKNAAHAQLGDDLKELGGESAGSDYSKLKAAAGAEGDYKAVMAKGLKHFAENQLAGDLATAEGVIKTVASAQMIKSGVSGPAAYMVFDAMAGQARRAATQQRNVQRTVIANHISEIANTVLDTGNENEENPLSAEAASFVKAAIHGEGDEPSLAKKSLDRALKAPSVSTGMAIVAKLVDLHTPSPNSEVELGLTLTVPIVGTPKAGAGLTISLGGKAGKGGDGKECELEVSVGLGVKGEIPGAGASFTASAIVSSKGKDTATAIKGLSYAVYRYLSNSGVRDEKGAQHAPLDGKSKKQGLTGTLAEASGLASVGRGLKSGAKAIHAPAAAKKKQGFRHLANCWAGAASLDDRGEKAAAKALNRTEDVGHTEQAEIWAAMMETEIFGPADNPDPEAVAAYAAKQELGVEVGMGDSKAEVAFSREVKHEYKAEDIKKTTEAYLKSHGLNATAGLGLGASGVGKLNARRKRVIAKQAQNVGTTYAVEGKFGLSAAPGQLGAGVAAQDLDFGLGFEWAWGAKPAEWKFSASCGFSLDAGKDPGTAAEKMVNLIPSIINGGSKMFEGVKALINKLSTGKSGKEDVQMADDVLFALGEIDKAKGGGISGAFNFGNDQGGTDMAEGGSLIGPEASADDGGNEAVKSKKSLTFELEISHEGVQVAVKEAKEAELGIGVGKAAGGMPIGLTGEFSRSKVLMQLAVELDKTFKATTQDDWFFAPAKLQTNKKDQRSWGEKLMAGTAKFNGPDGHEYEMGMAQLKKNMAAAKKTAGAAIGAHGGNRLNAMTHGYAGKAASGLGAIGGSVAGATGTAAGKAAHLAGSVAGGTAHLAGGLASGVGQLAQGTAKAAASVPVIAVSGVLLTAEKAGQLAVAGVQASAHAALEVAKSKAAGAGRIKK